MEKRFFGSFWCKKLCFLLSFMFLILFASGCGSVDSEDKTAVTEMLISNVDVVESVQTSITLYMDGSYYDYNEKGEAIGTDRAPHHALVDSKIDIYASYKPLAFRSESFSNITIDGFTTNETRFGYTVSDKSKYIDYESVNNEEKWSKTIVSRPMELSLPRRTGLKFDWEGFMSELEYVETEEKSEGPSVVIFRGRVSSAVLQEIFTNRIFDNFVSNVEWVLNETLPCTLYLSGDTYLPQSFELDLTNEFVTRDVTFTEAKVTVSYSNWDQLGNITVPKKVSVLAEDHNAAQYSSFSARDLFIPYEPDENNTEVLQESPVNNVTTVPELPINPEAAN